MTYREGVLDTHVHFDAPRFDADRDSVVARASAAGVTSLLVPGMHARQWEHGRAIARRYGFLHAVGTQVSMDLQEDVLRAQLTRARDTGLPLVLHCVGAHARLLAILRASGTVRGVLHGYSGGPGLVGDDVRAVLHLGFGGIVTREGAPRVIEALRGEPLAGPLAENAESLGWGAAA